MKDLIEQVKENGTQFVKDNVATILGAVVGYVVSDNEKAKSAILGAVAGKVLTDKKEK